VRVTVQRVLDAIDETAGRIPRLTVITADCHGASWLADPTTDTIYISPRQPAARWATCCLDALDALCDHHDVARPGRIMLRLIPSPRSYPANAMTGTSD
jgi:hypothetical protein